MLGIHKEFVSSEVISQAYSKDIIFLKSLTGLPKNNYVLLRSNIDNQSTALVRHIGEGRCVVIDHSKLQHSKLEPRDAQQTVFSDSLMNEDILLNLCVGTAGTGKTTLALSYAAHAFVEHQRRILLCKPTVLVGKSSAFGPVPGDVQEKYDPYLQSYKIVLKKILTNNSDSYIDRMIQKGDIQFIPLEYARGSTFDNCTFILDEAQNLSWHEVNTIVSRLGENSKMIILGDLKQIDTGLHYKATGLHKMISSNAFQNSEISSSIELITQYRSPVTQLVAEINEEINEHKEKRTYSQRNRVIT